MFAVIEIEQWYDGCESMECLATFNTEQEAEVYKRKLQDDRMAVAISRLNYITDFVVANKEELTAFGKWSEWSVDELIGHFNCGGISEFPGFNPPSLKDCKQGFQLWVIQIKPVSVDD
jgi:hypothetical protein